MSAADNSTSVKNECQREKQGCEKSDTNGAQSCRIDMLATLPLVGHLRLSR
jgi:hypothetical protein